MLSWIQDGGSCFYYTKFCSAQLILSLRWCLQLSSTLYSCTQRIFSLNIENSYNSLKVLIINFSSYWNITYQKLAGTWHNVTKRTRTHFCLTKCTSCQNETTKVKQNRKKISEKRKKANRLHRTCCHEDRVILGESPHTE